MGETSGIVVTGASEASEIVPELMALNQRQRALVLALAMTGDIATATEQAGYQNENQARRALRSKLVTEAMRALVKNDIETVGIAKAYRTMMELMNTGNSGPVRMAAAKWIAEAAGQGSDAKAPGQKPLNEMTEAELADFVEKQRRVLEQGGSLPVIVVTSPETGHIDGVATT